MGVKCDDTLLIIYLAAVPKEFSYPAAIPPLAISVGSYHNVDPESVPTFIDFVID